MAQQFGYVLDLVLLHVGEHWQGQDCRCILLCDRTRLHIETRESRRAGNRRRIMDSGLYPALLQVSLHITSVALLDPNHVQVIDAIDSLWHEWGDNAGSRGKQFVVGLGVPSSHFIALVEVSQFLLQYSCLKAVQATVVTN